LMVSLFRIMVVGVSSLFLFSSFGEAAKGKLSVYVVNYPLHYFAERIGGKSVEVSFPAPRNLDPAFWMPDPKTIAKYQKADLILLNGAGFAQWVRKASLPSLKVVNTSKSFQSQFISAQGGVVHTHGPGGDHSHSGTAFTTWLDFSLAVKQAEAIKKSFQWKNPEEKDSFQKNFESLKSELMDLDQQLKKVAAMKPKQPLLASHSLYHYFARRYQLNLESLMWEPNEFPPDDKWIHLKTKLKIHKAKWMVWEGKPLKKSIDRLMGLGVQSLVFDPCFNVPIQGDFMDVMKSNVENLKAAY